MHYNIDFNNDFVTFRWDESKSDEENYKIVDRPLKRKDCILMQSTGFADEQGNLLWESDVVRGDIDFVDGVNDDELVQYSQYLYITFFNGSFCACYVSHTKLKKNDLYFFSDYRRGVLPDVLVGNLYEHPHLWELTGEQPLATLINSNSNLQAEPVQ